MKKYLAVLALALGLPSTILGLFAVLYQLVQKGVISWNIALSVLILVIINILYLMIRYVNKRKN